MAGLVNLINRSCAVYGRSIGRIVNHRVILCYHNVGDAGRGWLANSRSIAVAEFEAQMRWLKDNVEVVSLDQISAGIGSSTRHQVAITFDDGYLNNLQTVMPILQRLDLPMTWFVATRFVDAAGQLPWWDMIDLLLAQSDACIEFEEREIQGSYRLDREADRSWLNTNLRAIVKQSSIARRDAIVDELSHQLSQLVDVPDNAFARAEEIAAVDWPGLEFGGHTVSHPNIAACDEASRSDELQEGKRRLEQISGRRLNWFAYPFGGPGTFDQAAADSVRASGFRGAVTLVAGTVTSASDPYQLPRIAISPKMPLPVFKARVSGTPLFAACQRLRRG